MSKSSTVFVCNSCGFESTKWLGKCPACNSWNTFYEEKVVNTNTSKTSTKERIKPEILKNVETKETIRIDTGYSEVNRTLGGGLVKGSLVLLGGEPRNTENLL